MLEPNRVSLPWVVFILTYKNTTRISISGADPMSIVKKKTFKNVK